MTTLQALKLANSYASYVPVVLATPNDSLLKGGISRDATAASASVSVELSAQALSLYKASLAAAATPTYTVAQALKLGALADTGSLTITDSAMNISSNFDKLVAINQKISAIKSTGGKSLSINETQFAAGLTASPQDGLLNKINNGQFKVAISGVHASNVSSIASYGSKVELMSVADTSANITAKLSDIAALGTKVSAITQTSKAGLALSYAETIQYANTLKKIDKGAYTLNLTDTASNIKTNLAAITKLGSKVSAITQTDTTETLAMNTADLTKNLATLKKINNGSFKVSLEDSAVAATKSWAVLSANQKNISSLRLTDATPALKLTAAQTTAGAGLIDKISNNSLSLAVADSGTNLSTNMSGLLAINSKITKITQTAVGNLAVSASQLQSEELTSLLGKLSPTSYGLTVSGADKTNIVSILANTHVKSVALNVTDGTLTSSDATIHAALQSSKITSIAVSNASIANLGTLSADKRVRSIGIKDSAINLSNEANLSALDALMKKKKGFISAIHLDTDARPLLSVAQTTYTKYASTVFSASKNFALEVDLGSPTAGVNLSQSQIQSALKTTANSNGSFSVQVWNFTKGAYNKPVSLNAGVNFVKLGSTSTFLDSGDAKLNAVLNVGSYTWEQNPAQATADTSIYALKPGVFSLGSGSAKSTITYKFLTSNSDASLSTVDKYGFNTMNSEQQSAVTSALNYISSLVNINFQRVTSDSTADINFGTNNQGTTSGGYATGANPALGPVNLLLNNQSSVNTNPQPGDYGWETIVHEIGHTLGLKHPGAYNAGGGVAPGPYLSAADDNRRNTIMSYKAPSDAAMNWVSTGNGGYSSQGVSPRTFMPIDILALQFLYGKNQTGISLSDSSKSLEDFQITQFTSSWVGMETLSSTAEGLSLDLSGISASNIVDMRAGAFSSINIKDTSYNAGIGTKAQTFYNLNNVGLAYDATISSLIGGTSSDVVYVSNNDVEIDGRSGTDTVYLYGGASDWTRSEGAASETIYTNGNVTAKLKNVESIAYYALATSPTMHSRIDLLV